ncbi:MAG TPA: Hsp20/alpha crystallin family protein [Solirubrobacteraceae bacterium]|nr:Hsp20/alpha crystallin family protein [Solirubrobacteraceae bacterium]
MPDNAHRPFRGVFDMFSELNRMREHWTEIEPTQGRTGPAPWVPVVDIFANGEDLVIRCELAGVAKEEIDVALSDGRLWISGERTGGPGDDADYYVSERRYGKFERSVKLGRQVTGAQISATVIDGLLEIVVEGGAEPRQHERIEVTGAEGEQVRLDVTG